MLANLQIRRIYRRRIAYPEIAQREIGDQAAISDYLEGIVRRGLVPRPVAEIINRYPDEEIQREAADLFWAMQRAEAWDERRERRQRLRMTLKALGYSMAGLCAVILVKEVRSSQSAARAIPQPMPAFRILPSEDIPKLPPAVVHPLPVKIKRAPPEVRPHPAKIRPVVPVKHSTVLENFAVRRRSNAIRFSWDPMGPGYTYTLYADDEPAMRHMRIVKEGISETTYTLGQQNARKAGSWWAITATNSYGGESPPSGAVTSSP